MTCMHIEWEWVKARWHDMKSKPQWWPYCLKLFFQWYFPWRIEPPHSSLLMSLPLDTCWGSPDVVVSELLFHCGNLRSHMCLSFFKCTSGDKTQAGTYQLMSLWLIYLWSANSIISGGDIIWGGHVWGCVWSGINIEPMCISIISIVLFVFPIENTAHSSFSLSS